MQVASGGALPISGRLVDMSVGGAAIELDGEEEPDLVLGAEWTLTFTCLSSRPLRLAAVVRSLPSPEEPSRYGFKFTENVRLSEDDHAAFVRLFNRRRDRRARPRLGERLSGTITTKGVTHEVLLRDLSLGGASLRVSPEAGLTLGSEFELRFSVPESNHSLSCLAVVKNVTVDSLGVRVGVATTVVTESGTRRSLGRARGALADYIARRLSDMDRYNHAFE